MNKVSCVARRMDGADNVIIKRLTPAIYCFYQSRLLLQNIFIIFV